MISCKPSIRSSVSSITLKTSDFVIEQVPKIKALGVFITAGLSNHATINHLISKVNYRLAVLRQVFKFCKKRTKIILMKSLVISILRYCSPLLINSNTNLISSKLQTQLMKCTGYILGYNPFKMTTLSIMRELKFLNMHSMITSESILYIYKVIYNSSPSSIHKYISYGKTDTVRHRTVKKP